MEALREGDMAFLEAHRHSGHRAGGWRYRQVVAQQIWNWFRPIDAWARANCYWCAAAWGVVGFMVAGWFV